MEIITGVERRRRWREARQARIRSLVEAFENWMVRQCTALSRHAELAKAKDYMHKRWPSFTRFRATMCG